MCNLVEVPSCVLTLPSLRKLDLQCNMINSLPKGFSEMTRLRELNLANNQFMHFPEEIFALKNLRMLKFCKNRISSIPAKITNLPRLADLRLNNNSISYVPSDLCDLKKLTVLQLENNKIKFLPPAFVNLTKLGEKGGQLKLKKNPLLFPPLPVCEQGACAVLAFMRQSASGKRSEVKGQEAQRTVKVEGTKVKVKTT